LVAGMVAWCRRWLGADPVEVLFRAGYLSELTGPRLAAARGVVVKARAPSARLRGCVTAQAALAAAGRPRRRPQRPSRPGLARPGRRRGADRLAGLRLAPVVGHADWESQNLRWDGVRPLAVHDWDSAVAQPEAVVAGLTAYEQARGGPRRPAGLRRLRVAGVA
jgi:hypothetical protein